MSVYALRCTSLRAHAMLALRHNLPASIATKPDVKCVRFSPNDTPEVLKESVFTTVGLHPALKPAVRITSTNPLVPLGSIEGLPDLTDTDSAIKSLDILLMEAGKNKWQHFDADCNVVVDCSGDGTVELLRSLRGSHELNQMGEAHLQDVQELLILTCSL